MFILNLQVHFRALDSHPEVLKPPPCILQAHYGALESARWSRGGYSDIGLSDTSTNLLLQKI
jgi:hypothetical protein